MTLSNHSVYLQMPNVVLYQKEHKVCLGCQAKSLVYKNLSGHQESSCLVINFKKEHENFVRNYRLKEDETATGIVRHLLGVDYKASFVVYHKPDTERCYHFEVVKLDHLLESAIG